jgi:HD-GYP domain-containing protein (c-di-GMP phosphodiesterase class II)
MVISIKDYFLALASLLDFLEVEFHNKPTNHCKRVALTALKIGRLKGLDEEELTLLGALSLLHDLGASQASLIQKLEKQTHPDIEVFPDHCKAGADLIRRIPYLRDHSDVILYHHERYDGNGFYKKKEGIPHLSEIITISDRIDMEIWNKGKNLEETLHLIDGERKKSFSPELADAALSVLGNAEITEEMCNTAIDSRIDQEFKGKTLDMKDEDVMQMTAAFSTIVDAKSPFTKNHSSGLEQKTGRMCRFYNFGSSKTCRMKVAANLHDIGKLSVPNRILDKDGRLTEEEFRVIKLHTYYTRQALEKIKGWEDITDWASDHHEKLNGKGYPIGKRASELCHESRLMGCLDIYQALIEPRPYKHGFSNEKAFSILDECVEMNQIDGDIVEDMKKVFRSRSAVD